MLNNKRNLTLVTFSADVFMCQYCQTGSQHGYWCLRLLYQGNIIDAFHWDRDGQSTLKYKERDEVFIGGRWTSPDKTRFQIVRSSLIMRVAANDSFFLQQDQLAFDF